MKSLIYENRSFLKSARIESDGENLVFTRRNISGENRVKIKIAQIRKISARKNMLSYALKIDRENGKPVLFGGLDKSAVEELKKHLGSLVEIHSAIKHQVVTLEQARKEASRVLDSLSKDFDARPIISYLINQGVQLDSSDIHITPRKEYAVIQYRIDGLLREVTRMNSDFYTRLIAAIKNRAKLPSYKKSTPQDGSFHFDEDNHDMDVRCATIPTLFGEKVVLRILNTDKTPLFLEDLGISENVLKSYRELISEPQGCIILTGPAGSGKTTTIFASLIHIYNNYEGTVNIATIEDPVEYSIEEFQQTQIKPAMGLTFAVGLKSLLRLDPDIMMVGEIRDPETAMTAVRTALTGHLIFTTLHARDSLGVFPRIIEMGIKPGMASSSVTAVLYQRLVRKLCPECQVESSPPPELLKSLSRYGKSIEKYYTSVGCPSCSGTRYSGRTGVFELLNVDENIRGMIMEGKPYGDLFDYCREKGMNFLWESALEKVKSGITDFDEIVRVCPQYNY